ncbi:ankyrin repeat-containing domain protein [Mycena albidolilacea]|uniref:Ankyrin repeat-containing domain protein n=1 Tax=Mycena albidolilacea TaxID=1033008 RepID=A0AAD7EGJ1_9AGAR|nr:ankyrin repeat-containing domain protein [Mycena albidolilacea]
MAETLGIVTGCIQLLDTGLKALEYVKDFLHGSEEQRKLVAEMATLKPMLVELEKRVRANPSSHTLQQMKEPLLIFKTALGHFIDTLRPAEGRLSKVSKQLTWALSNKKEAQERLAELERIKSLLTLWLINDVSDAGTAAERDKILEWITSLNFFQRQAEIFGVWQPGTGEWFLADAKFRDWESSAQRTLWCCGMPGAGKTVLVSMVVNHLRLQAQKTNTAVACMYLNHKEIEMQTPTNLLASLWKQLVVGKPMPPAVHELYKGHDERRTRPSPGEVLKVLRSAIGEYSKVYLIVDALDEYPEAPRLKLLEYLSIAMTAPTVNLMLTSRPHITLDPFFPGRRALDINATENDICQYIDVHIQQSPRLSKHVRMRPELSEEIKSRILKNVDGMFLLAKLHLDSLSTKNTVKAVRDALNSLPKDLDRTYDETMERIEHQNEDDRQLAHSVLTWVAYAVRPLLINELREALAIDPGAESVDPDNLLDTDIILSVCAGLVIVDEGMSAVRLIHYTTQEYMNSIQPRRFPLALMEIASKIFTYLASPDFSDLPDSPDKQWKRDTLASFADFFERNDALDALCVAAYYGRLKMVQLLVETGVDVNHNDHRIEEALQAAAEMGHENQNLEFLLHPRSCWGMELGLHPILLMENGGYDTTQVLYGTALHAASYRGHESIVKLLIEMGADTNIRRGHFGTALIAASHEGHQSVVQLLLKNGANINAVEEVYGTALHAAAMRDHQSLALLLVEKGADVNAHGGYYGTVLQAAMREEKDLMVEFLIKMGVDVNGRGEFYGTALQLAARSGAKSQSLLLIENGADVNALGGIYGTALQVASYWGHKAVAELLIKKGADVNAPPGTHGTALEAASTVFSFDPNDHPVSLDRNLPKQAIIRLLIENGADVNANGGIALQLASSQGNDDMVQFLIHLGADVNLNSFRFGTALLAATFKGHESTVRLLLESNADANAEDNILRTGLALLVASQAGHESVIRLLISLGADVNALLEAPVGTALQAASIGGHEYAARLLIENGADVNMCGGYLGTALLAASKAGHESLVRLLVTNNADINAQDELFGSALQVASKAGHELVIRSLIEMGADVNAHRSDHLTLSLASLDRLASMLVWLSLINDLSLLAAELGVFGTALQAAAKRGHKSVVRLLEDEGANAHIETILAFILDIKHCL